MSVESLARDTELKASIDEAVERLNAERTRVAGVKRYRLLAKSFTVESGELTPTMKIKRAVVQKKFAAEIEELYGAEVPRA